MRIASETGCHPRDAKTGAKKWQQIKQTKYDEEELKPILTDPFG